MSELDELTKWPTDSEDMTIDLMLRVIGRDTQVSWLKKMVALEGGADRREEYTGHLHAVLAGVGLMLCIKALRNQGPTAADAFVKDYWNLCDAGDEFGPLLWELAKDAGLDLDLVQLRTGE